MRHATKIALTVLASLIALPVFLIVVYTAVVATTGGRVSMVPPAVEGMAQAMVQGVRCGWEVDVPEDGWGCYAKHQARR